MTIATTKTNHCKENQTEKYCQKYFVLFWLSKSQMHTFHEKVQVGKDQEKAQSEKDSHSKNRDGKKLN